MIDIMKYRQVYTCHDLLFSAALTWAVMCLINHPCGAYVYRDGTAAPGNDSNIPWTQQSWPTLSTSLLADPDMYRLGCCSLFLQVTLLTTELRDFREARVRRWGILYWCPRDICCAFQNLKWLCWFYRVNSGREPGIYHMTCLIALS